MMRHHGVNNQRCPIKKIELGSLPSTPIEPHEPSPIWNQSVPLSWWLSPCRHDLRGRVFAMWACQPSFGPSCGNIRRNERWDWQMVSYCWLFQVLVSQGQLWSARYTWANKEFLTYFASVSMIIRSRKRSTWCGQFPTHFASVSSFSFCCFLPMMNCCFGVRCLGEWRWFGKSVTDWFHCVACNRWRIWNYVY